MKESQVVVIAEDEAAIRDLISESLRQEHLCVLQAATGDAALDLMRGREKIDLLITDVNMSGSKIDGIELAEQIRVERPETKLLVMSGYPESQDAALEKGIPLLRKPFGLAVLVEKVRELLA